MIQKKYKVAKVIAIFILIVILIYLLILKFGNINNRDLYIPTGNVDIFEYFYRLIILIRPKLEAGLSREQRLVNRYIRKQLSLLGKKEDEVYNPLFEALKKAGIPLNEEAQKALEDDEVDVYDLDKFNICIAMFSRFKLDTPYSLAFCLDWLDLAIMLALDSRQFLMCGSQKDG